MYTYREGDLLRIMIVFIAYTNLSMAIKWFPCASYVM